MGHQMKRMDAPFRKRMRRRLYYSDMTSMETPSLPLTELAVEYFRESVPQKLGHVDLYMGSNITKKNQVTPCSVVMSMLYAKRLRQRNKQYLQSMSSSDVFFISMMMASKYLYDEGVDEEVFNDEWADNTDQDVDDVNQMEINFLEAMDWRLFVRPEEFEEALIGIERRLALQEGLKRGWFTYSELSLLADSQMMAGVWTKLGIDCSKLATVFSTAYLAGLLSMLGSMALAVQLSGPVTTITLTLLTTQSSPFSMMASSGVQSLGPVPLGAIPSPPETPLHKMSEHDVESLDKEVKTGIEPATSSSCHSSVLSDASLIGEKVWSNTVHDVKRKEPNLEIGNRQNNSKKVDGTPTALKTERKSWLSSATSSSLWSVWLVDSLLSQLWSLVSRQKVAEPGDKFNTPEDSLDHLTRGHEEEASLGKSWRRKRRMGARHTQDNPTSCTDAEGNLIADVHALRSGGTEDELQWKLDRLGCWQCEDHEDSFLSVSTPDPKTRCRRYSNCGSGCDGDDKDKNSGTCDFSHSKWKKGRAVESRPSCAGRGCRGAISWNLHSKVLKDVKHERTRSNPRFFASWPTKLQAESPQYSLGIQLPAIGFFTGS